MSGVSSDSWILFHAHVAWQEKRLFPSFVLTEEVTEVLC